MYLATVSRVERPYPVPHGHHLNSGYLFRADSIEILAGKLAVPVQALHETIAENNRSAEIGLDEAFDKGRDTYQRYMGDHKFLNPCLGPIEKPPYYAVEISTSDLGTFAGLATDAETRVIQNDGAPVPGLYAVGNDAASIFGGAYPGAGATLGPALTFGDICALTLVGK